MLTRAVATHHTPPTVSFLMGLAKARVLVFLNLFVDGRRLGEAAAL